MRYLCTIYNHDYTFGGKQGFVGTEPAFDSPVGSVVVSGSSLRQAAARAYIRCVGQKRARQMRKDARAPRNVIAQETSCQAIAASLRKTAGRFGEFYELDNFLNGWLIKVEPVSSSTPATTALPQRLRLPLPFLFHRSPSPN